MGNLESSAVKLVAGGEAGKGAAKLSAFHKLSSTRSVKSAKGKDDGVEAKHNGGVPESGFTQGNDGDVAGPNGAVSAAEVRVENGAASAASGAIDGNTYEEIVHQDGRSKSQVKKLTAFLRKKKQGKKETTLGKEDEPEAGPVGRDSVAAKAVSSERKVSGAGDVTHIRGHTRVASNDRQLPEIPQVVSGVDMSPKHRRALPDLPPERTSLTGNSLQPPRNDHDTVAAAAVVTVADDDGGGGYDTYDHIQRDKNPQSVKKLQLRSKMDGLVANGDGYAKVIEQPKKTENTYSEADSTVGLASNQSQSVDVAPASFAYDSVEATYAHIGGDSDSGMIGLAGPRSDIVHVLSQPPYSTVKLPAARPLGNAGERHATTSVLDTPLPPPPIPEKRYSLEEELAAADGVVSRAVLQDEDSEENEYYSEPIELDSGGLHQSYAHRDLPADYDILTVRPPLSAVQERLAHFGIPDRPESEDNYYETVDKSRSNLSAPSLQREDVAERAAGAPLEKYFGSSDCDSLFETYSFPGCTSDNPLQSRVSLGIPAPTMAAGLAAPGNVRATAVMEEAIAERARESKRLASRKLPTAYEEVVIPELLVSASDSTAAEDNLGGIETSLATAGIATAKHISSSFKHGQPSNLVLQPKDHAKVNTLPAPTLPTDSGKVQPSNPAGGRQPSQRSRYGYEQVELGQPGGVVQAAGIAASAVPQLSSQTNGGDEAQTPEREPGKSAIKVDSGSPHETSLSTIGKPLAARARLPHIYDEIDESQQMKPLSTRARLPHVYDEIDESQQLKPLSARARLPHVYDEIDSAVPGTK